MNYRLFAFTLLLLTSVAFAAPKSQPKSNKNKKPVAIKPKAAPKRPTRLPKKKRITVDFDSHSAEPTTTVIVRTPLPLDEAVEDKSLAEKSMKDTQKQVEATAKTETPATTKTPPAPLAVTTPTPAPAPALEAPLETPVVTSEPVPMPPPLPEAATVTANSVVVIPEKFSKGLRLLARTSYVNAQYSRLSSELQDGQSTIAIGIENDFDRFSGRAILEIGHGMDQAVTIQNTRSFIVRGDLIHFFAKDATIQPLVGGGAGLVDLNVRSYRSNGEGPIYIREHARETSVLIAPFAGFRVKQSLFSLDLTLEYVAVMVDEPSAFGGWTGALTLGIPL